MPAGGDGVVHGFGTGHWAYSGTFTETGTAAGFHRPFDQLTSLSASFTIYGPGGAVLVKGTTTASSGSWCQSLSGAPTFLDATPAYQATIFTASGNYSDQGSSTLDVFTDSAETLIDEVFTSSLTQPVLISPTSKAQCMNGGWKSFGTSFKNQGDCVSFVATGGKH